MIDLNTTPYEFVCPPDSNWLPARFALFEEDRPLDSIPSQTDIQQKCRTIQQGWDCEERVMRKLRSEMACTFGVCRNH